MLKLIEAELEIQPLISSGMFQVVSKHTDGYGDVTGQRYHRCLLF